MAAELREIQKRIHDFRKLRGFVMDPQHIYMLLTEEVGEIASELKHEWSPKYQDFSLQRLRDEIADSFVCLCALANQYGIDLEEAVKDKFFEKDADRYGYRDD